MIETEYANPQIVTVFLAMLPVMELRGAIPFGLAQGLPFWEVLLLAFVGNMIPVPFIMLFIRRLLRMLYDLPMLGQIVLKIEHKVHLRGKMVNRYKFFGLLLLVAIPAPGTGAWTAALVATYLNIRIKYAFSIIALGVFISGVIVSWISYSAIKLL